MAEDSETLRVTELSRAVVPTSEGKFEAIVFESSVDKEQHVAFVKGTVSGAQDVLVRVHSECLTGDIFGSLRCDCGPQLSEALAKISEEGQGVLLYLRGHEGRGIGLAHKIRAYSLQDQGLDTVEANVELGLPVDAREYETGARILSMLGVTSMRLMTNNPAKYEGLEAYGLVVSEKVPLRIEPNEHNHSYLVTKQARMRHDLDL